MRFDPYLYFAGNCREAFEFYAAATGGTIETMMPYGGSPAEAMGGPEMADKILHATIAIGDSQLLGADAAGARPHQGFAVTLQMEDADQAKRVFAALAEGGKVTMPLQETFWTKGYGMLTDRFGVDWMINCA